MNLVRHNFIRHFAIAALTLVCITASQAQSKKQEAAAIRYARNLSVSKIEKGMPQTRFDTWFRRRAGKKMKIKYEVNDCGEQTGTSADKGRDFPMCVEADADSVDLHIVVMLGIGTLKRGITEPGPDMRGVSISVEGEGEIDFKKLSDLPKQLRKIVGK